MLCVDAITGEEYLKLKERSKTDSEAWRNAIDVSSYFTEFVNDCLKSGVKYLTIILDNNSTHKQKMRSQLVTNLSDLGIQEQIEVEFIYTPPYSPDFNLAEYIIHLLRLEVLHHQPVDTTIQLVQQKLENFLMIKHVQTPEQIQNTIEHIYRLI